MRYTATFSDGSTFWLYGEEFFNDKAVFSRVHHSNLVSFSSEVCLKGRPVRVFDKNQGETIEFASASDFDRWYKKNQSLKIDFGFADVDSLEAIIREGTSRINSIKDFLNREIEILQSNNFDPWRIDGGYKFIELQSNLGLNSFQRLKKQMPELNDHRFVNLMEECFAIPKTELENGYSLISYSQQSRENLNPKKLNNMCKHILQIIIQKEELIGRIPKS